jgi:galactose-1-phosphate uridylyltransferase
MQYSKYYTLMADGTIKQINPFTDNEVWSVPGRAGKPEGNGAVIPVTPLSPADLTSFCAFCSDRLFETPPEKARLLQNQDGAFVRADHIPPREMKEIPWLFRRVPNLFEIVTVDYWKQNYSYVLSPENLAWKEMYLADPVGLQHVHDILAYKLRATGISQERIQEIPEGQLLTMSDAFFGGGHELIIAAPHFRNGAKDASELFSSGDMTPEEHFQYVRFTIDAMTDIFAANRYIRYISVFQNWLPPAGASFDHLHKQLVGIDDWGASIRHQIDMLRQDPNIFNELGVNLAGMQNLIFAENEHAVAYAGIGHRHPTIEIYSKSYFSRPYEQSGEEIRAMSDLIHACHAASGSAISSNEEWYYTPVDAVYEMPWHVLIKWRVNTAAGFEGGTSIYINPIAPLDLRDRMVTNLYRLRNEGRVAPDIRIAKECVIHPNPLRYYLE